MSKRQDPAQQKAKAAAIKVAWKEVLQSGSGRMVLQDILEAALGHGRPIDCKEQDELQRQVGRYNAAVWMTSRIGSFGRDLEQRMKREYHEPVEPPTGAVKLLPGDKPNSVYERHAHGDPDNEPAAHQTARV